MLVSLQNSDVYTLILKLTKSTKEINLLHAGN